MIYTHVVKNGPYGVASPLDRLALIQDSGPRQSPDFTVVNSALCPEQRNGLVSFTDSHSVSPENVNTPRPETEVQLLGLERHILKVPYWIKATLAILFQAVEFLKTR
jgi:hypothetical protein